MLGGELRDIYSEKTLWGHSELSRHIVGSGGGVLPRTGVMVLPNHQGTGIVVMIRGCIVGNLSTAG